MEWDGVKFICLGLTEPDFFVAVKFLSSLTRFALFCKISRTALVADRSPIFFIFSAVDDASTLILASTVSPAIAMHTLAESSKLV